MALSAGSPPLDLFKANGSPRSVTLSPVVGNGGRTQFSPKLPQPQIGALYYVGIHWPTYTEY